jgi:RNA polymerase sigma-70 factor, ECF subfamily
MREDDEERLRRLYAEQAPALLAYALRRGATAEDAADLVADVFLVAWRRIGDVPAGAEARLWLYGAARHVLANQRRGERRRTRLGEALREHVRTVAPPPLEPVDPALDAALRSLPEIDRSLLALIAWEGLSAGEAATVLGLRHGTARVRLHRARARLRRALEATAARPCPTPVRQEH